MRWLGLAAAAVVLASAGSASAAVLYTLTVTGTIDSQVAPGPDTDPNLAVGSHLVLTATFDSATAIDWGSYGYSVAGFYGLLPTGSVNFSVTAPGLQWTSYDEIDDGDDWLFSYNNGTVGAVVPAAAFADGKVLGLEGYLVGAAGGPPKAPFGNKPNLNLGSILGNGSETETRAGVGPTIFDPGDFSDQFTIDGAQYYGNQYVSPGFVGTWDFADSTVTISAVPEPGIWALSILGMGLAGAALRRRRQLAARLAT